MEFFLSQTVFHSLGSLHNGKFRILPAEIEPLVSNVIPHHHSPDLCSSGYCVFQSFEAKLRHLQFPSKNRLETASEAHTFMGTTYCVKQRQLLSPYRVLLQEKYTEMYS